MASPGLIQNLSQLFFVKRRPRLHVPLEWKRPATEREYQQKLEYEGLISIDNWKEDDIAKFPLLKQDLADLEQHLLPAFWEYDQKARHYQNRFFLYQWIFMTGAMVTTLAGAVTTYIYTWEGNGGNLPLVLGYLTAVVSATTAYFNVLSNQGAPQKRWAKARRQTEELRMTYFRYLAHLEPYNEKDRVQRMRETVLSVRRKEFEDV